MTYAPLGKRGEMINDLNTFAIRHPDIDDRLVLWNSWAIDASCRGVLDDLDPDTMLWLFQMADVILSTPQWMRILNHDIEQHMAMIVAGQSDGIEVYE